LLPASWKRGGWLSATKSRRERNGNYAGLPIRKRRGFKNKITSTHNKVLAMIIAVGVFNKRKAITRLRY